MFVHIGEGTVLRTRRILGFFDLDGALGETAQFLRGREAADAAELLTEDIPRAFVLTDEAEGGRVYITRLSAAALAARAAEGYGSGAHAEAGRTTAAKNAEAAFPCLPES